MSRLSKVVMMAAIAMVAVSCGRSARIDAVLESAPSSEVVVKLLDVNRYEVLDTVATDASGKFVYKVKLSEGQPEFIYVFYKDTKVASLLLEAGDRVSVVADTLGNYSVEGSSESVRLAQVEKDYVAAVSRLNDIAMRLDAASDADEAIQLRKQMGQEYVNYYRDRVRYVLENSSSLTVVPVLYQNFGEGLPVFGQLTDAIHFANVADSIESVYPQSRYVKSLRKEARKRQDYLELETRLGMAEEIGYFDIELPDVQAQKRKLSEVDAKTVMIFFWSAADASQKMFNLDVLKSLYEDYHDRGFDIYQVSLDPDKAAWAKVMKEQKLPWTNVCDSRGSSSPYAAAYNVSVVPATYLLHDGELVDGKIVDEKSFRKLLDSLLK